MTNRVLLPVLGMFYVFGSLTAQTSSQLVNRIPFLMVSLDKTGSCTTSQPNLSAVNIMLIVSQVSDTSRTFRVLKTGQDLNPSITGSLTEHQARWVKKLSLAAGDYEILFDNGAQCSFQIGAAAQ